MADLSDLIQAMSKPDFYPHGPAAVDVVQTQMSVIFLTGDYVYKIKKPVDLGYLDYTTLDQRRLSCENELALNRRLCPDVYLAVVPITRRGQSYVLGGPGQPLEYAVKMKQLPRDRTLDVLLRQDRATTEMLSEVARKMALFHQQAATSPTISAFGSLRMISGNAEENFSQTGPYIDCGIPKRQWQRLKDYSDSFLQRNGPLFDSRVNGRRIRDCHGDLHTAHICFCDGICIFDCIEFNDRFRYCDVASEMAFLAMDIDHYGRADLSDGMVNEYAGASGDRQMLELLDFYKCYRAMVRGKVNCFKLDDPLVPQKEKPAAAETAKQYFNLAESYSLKAAGPLLIVIMGLVATGKSALAGSVATRAGVGVISSDVTRKQLLKVPLHERHFDEYDTGLYSQDITRQTYDAMLTEAGKLLKEGKAVVMDASFRKQAEREAARALARRHKARFLLVECRCSEEEIKCRLAKRLLEGSVSDGRWEVYLRQKTDADPVSGVPPLERLILDTAQPLPALTNSVLNRWGWWEEKETCN